MCIYLFEILISVPSDVHPEKELLDHMVVIFFFLATSILFFAMAIPFYHPTERFPFLHILVNISYVLSF